MMQQRARRLLHAIAIGGLLVAGSAGAEESATTAPGATAKPETHDNYLNPPTLLVLATRSGVREAGAVDPVALTNLVSSTVAERRIYRVLSDEDVRAMLSNEAQKQLAGCDDESCVAEIGQALGTNFLLYSHVGQAGDSLVASVSLIDAEDARVRARQSLIVNDRRQIADAMRVVTLRLLGEQAELPPPPPSLGSSGPLAFWKWPALGAGALAALVGAGGTGLALLFAAQANDATQQKQLDAARSNGGIANGVAIGGYAVGGALLVAAAGLFVADAVWPADDAAIAAAAQGDGAAASPGGAP